MAKHSFVTQLCGIKYLLFVFMVFSPFDENNECVSETVAINFLLIIPLSTCSFKNVTLLFSGYHLQSLQCLCLRSYADFC